MGLFDQAGQAENLEREVLELFAALWPYPHIAIAATRLVMSDVAGTGRNVFFSSDVQPAGMDVGKVFIDLHDLPSKLGRMRCC